MFGDVVGGGATASRSVTFSNSGQAPLTIPAGSVSLSGDAADQFQLLGIPSEELLLAPGESFDIAVNFGATALGPQGARLSILSDDSSSPFSSVELRGLGTRGEQGNLEPSLQWILDTYQIGSRTGDLDAAEPTIDLTPGANDEVIAPLFTKAGPGPVSIVPIAVYSNNASPALTLGYYTKATPTASITRKQLYAVPSPDVQTLNPRVTGTSTFDPGAATFGLYSTWAAQNNRTVYSEDFRNTFIANPGLQRMFKIYPLINADGTVVANAYVVGNEEAFNHDYQDAVYIIRNVTPAQAFPAPVPNAITGLTLVNADTGKDIGPLTNGQIVDFSQIGTTHLSVRAAVSGTPASVKFVVGSFVHTENSAPYTINGDVGADYTAWTPAIGTNVLKVTPYGATNATGTVGTAMSVTFTVAKNAPASPPVVPPPPVSPPPPVTTPIVYQAESATLSGATAANTNAGFAGSGYADFTNASGDSIQWNVSSATGGSIKLTFRYANGAATNRPLALRVNGVTMNPSLAFNSTGSWATWKTVTITVQLTAGVNNILLSSIGSNGGNIDSLTVG